MADMIPARRIVQRADSTVFYDLNGTVLSELPNLRLLRQYRYHWFAIAQEETKTRQLANNPGKYMAIDTDARRDLMIWVYSYFVLEGAVPINHPITDWESFIDDEAMTPEMAISYYPVGVRGRTKRGATPWKLYLRRDFSFDSDGLIAG